MTRPVSRYAPSAPCKSLITAPLSGTRPDALAADTARWPAPLMSPSLEERPYIFYIPPQCQDVDRMNFRQCIYSYYQITLAADGYVYKCSSTASPSFKMNRLGKIPENLNKLNPMIVANHGPNFNASTCFKVGARCNRIALEINTTWARMNAKD